MAVILVPKFDKTKIIQILEKKRKGIKNAILLNLKRVGEQFVAQARDNDTYKDRTGNLRSSIGYVILYNGRQIKQNFENRGGKKGVETAKKFIDDAKKNFPTGFVLIGVAGMDYAAAVESRGLDVITASSQQAEISLKEAINRIKIKIEG
jgi:hypothetical protein